MPRLRIAGMAPWDLDQSRSRHRAAELASDAAFCPLPRIFEPKPPTISRRLWPSTSGVRSPFICRSQCLVYSGGLRYRREFLLVGVGVKNSESATAKYSGMARFF